MSMEVELPDGRILDVEADDPTSAAAAAKKFMESNPTPTSSTPATTAPVQTQSTTSEGDGETDQGGLSNYISNALSPVFHGMVSSQEATKGGLRGLANAAASLPATAATYYRYFEHIPGINLLTNPLAEGSEALAKDLQEYADKPELKPLVQGHEQVLQSPSLLPEYAASAVGEQAPNVAAAIGGGAVAGLKGVTAVGALLNTGESAARQIRESGQVTDPTLVTIAGTLKTTLDTAGPAMLATRLGMTTGATSGLWKAVEDRVKQLGIAGTALLNTGIEVPTEVAQDIIDETVLGYMKDNSAVFSPEKIKQYKETGVSTAIVSLLTGGLAGAFDTKGAPRTIEGISEEQNIVDPLADEDIWNTAAREITQARSRIPGIPVPEAPTPVTEEEVLKQEGTPAADIQVESAPTPPEVTEADFPQVDVPAAPIPPAVTEEDFARQDSLTPPVKPGYVRLYQHEGVEGLSRDPNGASKFVDVREKAKMIQDSKPGEVIPLTPQMAPRLQDFTANAEPTVGPWGIGHSGSVAELSPELRKPIEEMKTTELLRSTRSTLKETGLEGKKPEELFVEQAKDAARPGDRPSLDRFNWSIRWFNNIWQIADQNPHIPELRQYTETVDASHTYRMQQIGQVEERLGDIRSIGKEDSKRLGDALFALRDLKEWPIDIDIWKESRGLKKDTKASELFDKIALDFRTFIDKMEQVHLDSIKQSSMPLQDKVRAIQEAKANFGEYRTKPYFPLLRFGKHTIVVKRGKRTVYMESFESEKDQKDNFARIKSAATKADPATRTYMSQIPESLVHYQYAHPGLISMLKDKLDLTDAQREQLDDIAMSMLPSTSFMNRFRKANKVKGFSQDWQRAYTYYMYHGANYLSRITFDPKLQGIIAQARDAAANLIATQAPTDMSKRVQIIDYMDRHRRYMWDPTSEWVGLKVLATNMLLGFAPDSAIVQTTQVPMVSYPFLAHNFGDARAIGALSRAGLRIRQLMKDPTKAKLSPSLAKAMDAAHFEGIVDQNFAADVASASEMNNLKRTMTGRASEVAMQNFHRWSMMMMRIAEKMNRVATFSAAYELAMKHPDAEYIQLAKSRNLQRYAELMNKGFSQEEAQAYVTAKDATRRTQFEMTRWARPEYMRGKKGTLTIFSNFTQNMLWAATNNPGMWRYWVLMLAAAGLKGLPFSQEILDMASLLGSKLSGGRPFNARVELQKFLSEVTESPHWAETILNGFGRYGFHIKDAAEALGVAGVPSVDIGKRLGLGSYYIIPGARPAMQLADAGTDAAMSAILGTPRHVTLDTKSFMGSALQDTIGPLGGVAGQLVMGLSSDSTNSWRDSVPIRGLRNVFQAAEMYNRGAATDKYGNTILPFDVNDTEQLAEIIAKGLGLQPTELAQTQEQNFFKSEALRAWQIRKHLVIEQFKHARNMGDREGLADMRERIRDFNRGAPPGLKITYQGLKTSVNRGQFISKVKSVGGITTKSTVPLGRQTVEGFPQTRSSRPGVPIPSE